MVPDGRIFSVDALLGRTPLDHYSLIPDPAVCFASRFLLFINLGCYQIVTRCLCYL
ncbi:acnA regulatory region 60-length spurious protein [Escherichia coli]|nr:acnA regulatory region 60-length spurious protein [Escherichia coli]